MKLNLITLFLSLIAVPMAQGGHRGDLSERQNMDEVQDRKLYYRPPQQTCARSGQYCGYGELPCCSGYYCDPSEYHVCVPMYNGKGGKGKGGKRGKGGKGKGGKGKGGKGKGGKRSKSDYNFNYNYYYGY